MFKDKIPVHKKMTRFNINISAEISVHNPETIAKYIFRDVATITSEQSMNLLSDYIEIFTKRFFFKVNLDNYELTNDISSNYRDKLTKYLYKIGITLTKLSISIGNKNSPEKSSGFFNHLDIIDAETNDIQLKSASDSSVEPIEKNNTADYCTSCNNKLIDGSMFCHKCGELVKSRLTIKGDNNEKV